MAVEHGDFAHSVAPEPHRDRTKEILRRHPEIRELIGPYPPTFWWAIGIVALRIAIAVALADAPWWMVFVVAYCVGAFANNSLFFVVHEWARGLVVLKKLSNV